MKQIALTPAAGKRLIGKGMTAHPALSKALKTATVVITGGTTNGYVAEEILASIGTMETFPRTHFFRGSTTPPGYAFPKIEDRYMGDVVIVKGAWQKGALITDVVDTLAAGDFILKGANALNLERRQAAVLIGNPAGGTVMSVLKASLGKRVGVIIPVGLEKRIPGDLNALAAKVDGPGGAGLRFMALPGEVFTEIDAISLLTGAIAELIGSGGVCGAEGACWFAITGTPEQEAKAEALLKSIAAEPQFKL